MKKEIVIYYSFEGNTQFIAEELAKRFNIDVYRIKPIKDLKSTGFSKFIWGGKQVYMNELPKLEAISINLDDYERIYLGTPIWAWTIAPAIKTLLEHYLKNKDIYLFYTHEGGDQKVIEKGQTALTHHNRLVTFKGFLNVLKNQENCLKELDDWIDEIKKG
jgi:flavodoxin